jgi:hypothetical protein
MLVHIILPRCRRNPQQREDPSRKEAHPNQNARKEAEKNKDKLWGRP